MATQCTANPRTFLKTWMPSSPNLRPDMSHGLATPYFTPIGEEKIHLNLANLIKRGRKGRENLMGDVCDHEGFGDVLARSLLQVLQIKFWVPWVRLDSLWAGGECTHCRPVDRPPSRCKARAVQGLPSPTRGSTPPSRSGEYCSHPMQRQAATSDVHHYLQWSRHCSPHPCFQWALGRTARVRVRGVYCPVNPCV